METFYTLTSFSIFASWVTANVVALFLCIPAWRLTKEKGFLWWIADALFSLWREIMAHSYVTTDRMMFEVFEYVYWWGGVLSNILFTVGLVLIIRRFLKLFEATQNKPSQEG